MNFTVNSQLTKGKPETNREGKMSTVGREIISSLCLLIEEKHENREWKMCTSNQVGKVGLKENSSLYLAYPGQTRKKQRAEKDKIDSKKQLFIFVI